MGHFILKSDKLFGCLFFRGPKVWVRRLLVWDNFDQKKPSTWSFSWTTNMKLTMSILKGRKKEDYLIHLMQWRVKLRPIMYVRLGWDRVPWCAEMVKWLVPNWLGMNPRFYTVGCWNVRNKIMNILCWTGPIPFAIHRDTDLSLPCPCTLRMGPHHLFWPYR